MTLVYCTPQQMLSPWSRTKAVLTWNPQTFLAAQYLTYESLNFCMLPITVCFPLLLVKALLQCFQGHCLSSYPGPRGFPLPRRDKKTSGSGQCESHNHAMIGVTRID